LPRKLLKRHYKATRKAAEGTDPIRRQKGNYMSSLTNLTAFSKPEFGMIRTTAIDGEPCFVGRDVARILGYANPNDALAKHVDEEDKGVAKCDTPGGVQELTVINESGLYSLVLSSKLPNAKQFKHWVTAEVLPSIRKHGAYATPATIESIINNPDFGIRLLQSLKEEQEKNKTLAAENSRLAVDRQIMQPKADYFDELVDRNLLTSFTDAAKELGIKRKTFITFLLDKGYIYRDKKGNLVPRANSKAAALFEVKQCSNGKTGWAGCQTLITPKGVETFKLLCQGL
jgi:prophage antirepressor-like protein